MDPQREALQEPVTHPYEDEGEVEEIEDYIEEA